MRIVVMFDVKDQVGSYTLLKPLSNGQFGEVWLAEKRTPLATIKVALKLPNLSAVDVELSAASGAAAIRRGGVFAATTVGAFDCAAVGGFERSIVRFPRA